MKTYNAVIKGTTAILQHRFNEHAEVDGAKSTRSVLVQRGTPREEADKVCYRNKEGKYYAPATWILRMLAEAASAHKLKGSRKSAKYVVPAAVTICTDDILILGRDQKTPVKDYEVYGTPVTIPATKGRIMRYRPRFDDWSMRFNLLINDNILEADFIHGLLVEGGRQVGIGDFRPQKFGPFGTFSVVKWEENKE